MFEECPLPQIPKDAPSLGWRHSRVVRTVLEFQSGNAILAQVQGTCLDYSRVSIQHIALIPAVVCKTKTRKKNHWELLEDSERSGEPSSRSCQADLRSGTTGQTPAAAKQLCSEVAAGKLLYSVYYGRISRCPSYSRKET